MRNKIVLFGLLILLGLVFAEGLFDFLFGPPSPNASVEPTQPQAVNTLSSGGQGSALTSNELGQVISILNSILARVQAIDENTKPPAETVVTGNVVLFDTNGNYNFKTTQGNHVIALPPGKCEIAVFAGPKIDAELSEMNSFGDRRAEQECNDEWVCRKTVTIDGSYPFLKLFWVETDSKVSDTDRATLAYRCVAKESTTISPAAGQNTQ